MPEIEPLNPDKATFRQSKTEILPKLPLRALVLGPSSGGKTTMITRLLIDEQFYRGAFSEIYWFSPSASVDPGLDALRDYVAQIQDQEERPTFHDDFDPTFVRDILERARSVTENQKSKGSAKRFNVLVVIDDHADRPDLLKKTGGVFETTFADHGDGTATATFALTPAAARG